MSEMKQGRKERKVKNGWEVGNKVEVRGDRGRKKGTTGKKGVKRK
jgi:hypothetical protein